LADTENFWHEKTIKQFDVNDYSFDHLI